MSTETTGPLPSRRPRPDDDEELAAPPRSRRRLGFIILITLAAILGVAAGAFAGLPGMVERAGRTAIARLEDRFGLRIDAAHVDWSFGGHVEARDVVVRAPGASGASDDDVIATVATITVDADVDAFDRRIRVHRIALDRPVMKLSRDADGRMNVDAVIAALARMRDAGRGGAGGGFGGIELVPELPIVAIDDATLAVDAVLPALPFGLTLPSTFTFEGGRITLRPTDASPTERFADTPIRVEAEFATSSLDPGQPLKLSAEGPLAGPPTRLELRPARPVRFWLGDRVAGVGGIALTSTGIELGPLQLSVPIARDGSASRVAAAASCDKLVVAPAPRELLRRINRALAKNPTMSRLAAAQSAFDSIELVHPVLSLSIDARGHHDLEDLLPDLASLVEPITVLAPAAEKDLVSAVSEAHVRASEKLLSRAAGAEAAKDRTAPLAERVAGRFAALDRTARAKISTLARVVSRLPATAIAVTDGELLLGLGESQVTLSGVGLALERSHDKLAARFSVASLDDGSLALRDEKATAQGELRLEGETLHAELALRKIPLALSSAVGALGTQEDDGARDKGAAPAPSQEGVSVAPVGEITRLVAALDADRAGDTWELTAQLAVTGAEVRAPSLAADTLERLSFEGRATVRWNAAESRFTVADGVVASHGVTIGVSLDVADAVRRPKVHLELELPETPVQRVVEAMPQGFAPLLQGLRMDGTLAWPVSVDLDTAAPRDIAIVSRPVSRGLRVLTLGDRVDLAALRGSHSYAIRLADGTEGRRLVGPMTGSWVPLVDITPYLPLALTTTEDGTFYSNEGISTRAMQESIATNLDRGSFVRGGSTLTQQLVKNLYLGSGKTISRKLQEIFIAWQMSRQLTKDEIMALYLNTIEFGPGIYGIGDAAWHWFGKRPIDLTLTESIFFASIIPGPRRYYSFFEQGSITPRWKDYLQRLLAIMVERGKITEEELAAAAPYEPQFRGAGGGYHTAPPPEGFDAIPEDDDFGEP